MVRVGVVLSGCGHLDGSEIHEAVLTAYFLGLEGAEVVFCAPDVDLDVVDHLTGEPVEGETRNVLTESARIARGHIVSTGSVQAKDLDALVLPGGFGAARNLSTFATDGPACHVHPEVEELVRDAHGAGLPIGAICIAPAVVARVLGKEVHPRLTIGHDEGTAAALAQCGARHEEQPVEGITVDEDNRIVSTPAYMLGPGIADVGRGIAALCSRIVAMAGEPQAVG